jgi:hypothetical protein
LPLVLGCLVFLPNLLPGCSSPYILFTNKKIKIAGEYCNSIINPS